MKIDNEEPRYRVLRKAYTSAKALGDKPGAKKVKKELQEFGASKAAMRRVGTLPQRFPRGR